MEWQGQRSERRLREDGFNFLYPIFFTKRALCGELFFLFIATRRLQQLFNVSETSTKGQVSQSQCLWDALTFLIS